MAVYSVTTHPHVEVLPARLFNIPKERLDPAARPRHLVVGQEMGGTDSQVFVHTAGRDVVWAAPLSAMVTNRRFIRGVDPAEAVRIGYAAGLIRGMELLV